MFISLKPAVHFQPFIAFFAIESHFIGAHQIFSRHFSLLQTSNNVGTFQALSPVFRNLNCQLRGASRYVILLLWSNAADLSAQQRRSTTIAEII